MCRTNLHLHSNYLEKEKKKKTINKAPRQRRSHSGRAEKRPFGEDYVTHPNSFEPHDSLSGRHDPSLKGKEMKAQKMSNNLRVFTVHR